MTACKNCKYLQSLKQQDRGIWYNHHCAGAAKIKTYDSFSDTWEESLPFCRDINTHGRCPFFKEKEGKK